MKKLTVLFFSVVLLLSGCGAGGEGNGDGNTIVVSGKEFTEQFILADILYYLLDENLDDVNVEHHGSLGGVTVLHQAMTDEDIDLYIEYTGTAYLNILDLELDTTEPDTIYERTKEGYEENFNITWLDPWEFNNTYALSMRRDQAEELGVETNSDLADQSSEMTFAADSEFYERPDGFDVMNEEYGFTWGNDIDIDPDLLYEAVRDEEVDVITGFATDPRIVAYDLVLLEDDLGFFPPYFAAPVIRQEVLDANPEVEDLLREIGPHLTDEKMSELNAQVNIDGMDSNDVAWEFLVEIGMIEE